MSITAVQWALDLPKRISSSEKAILLVMCFRADERGECFPSHQRLSIDTCLDRKTVISSLQALIEKRLVKKTGRFTGRTKKVPIYEVAINKPTYDLSIDQDPDSLFELPQRKSRITYIDPKNTPVHDGRFLNSSKNGTVKNSNITENGIGNGPKNGTLNGPKNGTQKRSLERSKKDHSHTLSSKAPSARSFVSSKGPKREELLNAAFDYFWDNGGFTQGRHRACKAWAKLNALGKDPMEFARMVVSDYQHRCAKHFHWREVQFRPSAANYLQDRKWEDGIIPYLASKPSVKSQYSTVEKMVNKNSSYPTSSKKSLNLERLIENMDRAPRPVSQAALDQISKMRSLTCSASPLS